jgi:probable phosphoglycerate mutase
MNLFLLRHGLSVANTQRLVTGNILDPLTDIGRKQACAASVLAEMYGLSFDVCFVSHWLRAAETAALFLPNMNFIVDRRLGETDAGGASNILVDLFLKENPAYIHPCDPQLKYPDGECHQELYDRTIDWLCEIANSLPPEASVLAVTHSGPISCILQYICGLPMTHFPVFLPTHCSLSQVFLPPGGQGKCIKTFSVEAPKQAI